MSIRTDRRRFLRASATGGALLGLGDLSFLSRLRPVSADEANLDPKVVRLQPEIEPLVRLLEDTPRERLLEEVAARMREGHWLTAKCWRRSCWPACATCSRGPASGHKFHAVLVVNSAHLASLGSPDTDRWLPIFWALDYFKSSQAAGRPRGQLDDGAGGRVGRPAGRKARKAFIAAMDRWDESAADAAVAGLARTAGSNEVYELFFRYGAATSATSATRRSTWPTVGGRSSASAGSTPSRSSARWPTPCSCTRTATRPTRDDPADRPWRHNQDRAARIKEGWTGGKPDAGGRGRPAHDTPHGLGRRRLRAGRRAARTAGSRRSRSGTPCSPAPGNCSSASRGSSRCTR